MQHATRTPTCGKPTPTFKGVGFPQILTCICNKTIVSIRTQRRKRGKKYTYGPNDIYLVSFGHFLIVTTVMSCIPQVMTCIYNKTFVSIRNIKKRGGNRPMSQMTHVWCCLGSFLSSLIYNKTFVSIRNMKGKKHLWPKQHMSCVVWALSHCYHCPVMYSIGYDLYI